VREIKEIKEKIKISERQKKRDVHKKNLKSQRAKERQVIIYKRDSKLIRSGHRKNFFF